MVWHFQETLHRWCYLHPYMTPQLIQEGLFTQLILLCIVVLPPIGYQIMFMKIGAYFEVAFLPTLLRLERLVWNIDFICSFNIVGPNNSTNFLWVKSSSFVERRWILFLCRTMTAKSKTSIHIQSYIYIYIYCIVSIIGAMYQSIIWNYSFEWIKLILWELHLRNRCTSAHLNMTQHW